MSPYDRSDLDSPITRSLSSALARSPFCRDERAIEGLAVAELDVRPEEDVVTPGSHELDLVVVDSDGHPVPCATVVVKNGSASLADGVVTAETGDRGVASVSIAPSPLAHQQDGTVVVDVKPPAGSRYVNRRDNTEILVVRGE
jgi:hypothetical protein